MLGFRKIRQLEQIIPTTGYMIPIANPEGSEVSETFGCALSDAMITTDLKWNNVSRKIEIEEKPKFLKFNKAKGDDLPGLPTSSLYITDGGIGSATFLETEINIELEIADVIAQTDAADCVITCPGHGFMDFDTVNIRNIDPTVNQVWPIDVIDDDSFFLLGTKGAGNHTAIYPGEGGTCIKKGGLKLDIWQNEKDQSRNKGRIEINITDVKEIYYNEEPVMELYYNTPFELMWKRIGGMQI